MFSYEHYVESTQAITAKIGDFKPSVLIALGTGFGAFADEVQSPVFVEYKDVPNMGVSTVSDHRGRFVFGTLHGVSVMLMQGRIHVYEGYTPEQVAFPVRLAKLLGVHSMIATNAAGAVNTCFEVGDLMIIDDHIRLMAQSPLIGKNIKQFGPRCCDMTYTYTPKYLCLARQHADKLKIPLRQGVYMYFAGPQFETPAEIRAARILGADAVGMSTVFEATTASHCGMQVLGISLMTNMAAGVLDQRLDHLDITKAADQAAGNFSRLMAAVLPEMRG